MTVLFTIQHPAHVHFFRHTISTLQDNGVETHVFARENDIAVSLLNEFGIEHTVLVGGANSVSSLAKVQALYELRLLRHARRINPDLLFAIGGVAISHVARIVGGKSIVFIDNEGITSHRLMAPFAHYICTPERFSNDYGDKHIRYAGYQELAYLHPDRFAPDPDRLRSHGIDPEETYYVCRFKRWDALHDVGERGLSESGKHKLVETFGKGGSVYISSTDELPEELEQYRLPVPPILMHDLLYYANGYAGDSGTMATEAAVLGTPAIRIQSFAGHSVDMSNFVELEEEYQLLWSTSDEQIAIDYAKRITDTPDIHRNWKRRRSKLFDDKIDVTTFILHLISEFNRTGTVSPAGVRMESPVDVLQG